VLDDLDEVAVLQLNHIETPCEIVDLLFKVLYVGTRHVRTDQLGQVPLPGDEGDDRHRSAAVAGLDQFHQALYLVADEVLLPHVCLEPEDQLVEEEHDAVVAERLGMPGDDLQPVLQRDEGVLVAASRLDVRRHRATDQRGHQSFAQRVTGVRREGAVQVRAAPVTCGSDITRTGVEDGHVILVLALLLAPVRRESGRRLGVRAEPLPERGVVREELTLPARVGEQCVGPVHGGGRRLGMEGAHPVHIATEQGGIQVGGADQVVGHHQEPAGGQPVPVLGDDLGQSRLAPGRRMIVQRRVQHGQEVTLTGTERSMEIRGVRVTAADGGGHDPERLAELLLQLIGDDVLGHPRIGFTEALREIDLEIARVDIFLDVDDIAQDELSGRHQRSFPHSAGPRQDWQGHVACSAPLPILPGHGGTEPAHRALRTAPDAAG
jgi:hypothetical protein